jgi:endoglucanase
MTSWRSSVRVHRRDAIAQIALLLVCCLTMPSLVRAMPAADRTAALARGVNITGWFRFPSSRDPSSLRSWLSDAAMASLKRAGFTFVRLAIDPDVVAEAEPRAVLIDQIRRLRRQGLAVIVSPHPVAWRIDTDAADQARLLAFWRELAPALRGLDPALTFPETLNEPVFHDDPARWWALQEQLRATIRAALPDDTIVLTGHDWSSIAGLLALKPSTDDNASTDDNVIYSFHFYDPPELTTLAAWRPELDHAALGRLPFPESDPVACARLADKTSDRPTGDLIRYWCATGWDAERVRQEIRAAGDWGRVHHVALLAAEFGASARLNLAARLAWLGTVRLACAEQGIGWALWGYDDVMGFNITRPPANDPLLDRSVLEALGLRAPRANQSRQRANHDSGPITTAGKS